jgi:hypothetical protein
MIYGSQVNPEPLTQPRQVVSLATGAVGAEQAETTKEATTRTA